MAFVNEKLTPTQREELAKKKFVRSLSITVPVQYEDEIYKLYPLVWIPELL